MLKPGVFGECHTIIFTESPKALRGEDKDGNLRLMPVKVTPSNPRDKLDPASRLNYGRLYTVDHNVKVWVVGRIHRDFEQQLQLDFDRFHPEIKNSGRPLPSNSYDTDGQPQASHPQALSTACQPVHTSVYKYDQTSSIPYTSPGSYYSKDQAYSLYTPRPNAYPRSTSYGLPESSIETTPGPYHPSAQSSYDVQGQGSGVEPDLEDESTEGGPGQVWKRSDSSGDPRFPKSGQRFKTWKDEGTFYL